MNIVVLKYFDRKIIKKKRPRRQCGGRRDAPYIGDQSTGELQEQSCKIKHLRYKMADKTCTMKGER